jgi:ABC-type amino acid transport substrate-binding protein
VGRIARGDGLGVLVPRGEGLDVRDVDRELRALRRDGTLARLSRAWLGLDPAGLRILR